MIRPLSAQKWGFLSLFFLILAAFSCQEAFAANAMVSGTMVVPDASSPLMRQIVAQLEGVPIAKVPLPDLIKAVKRVVDANPKEVAAIVAGLLSVDRLDTQDIAGPIVAAAIIGLGPDAPNILVSQSVQTGVELEPDLVIAIVQSAAKVSRCDALPFVVQGARAGLGTQKIAMAVVPFGNSVVVQSETQNTVAVDGKNTVAVDGKNTVAVDGKNTVAIDGKNTVAIDGKNTVAVDGKNTVAVDGKNTVAVDGKNVVSVDGSQPMATTDETLMEIAQAVYNVRSDCSPNPASLIKPPPDPDPNVTPPPIAEPSPTPGSMPTPGPTPVPPMDPHPQPSPTPVPSLPSPTPTIPSN